MTPTIHLLEVIRDAAGRGEDLVQALRRSHVAGAELVADRLATGMAVPTALAGLVPPQIALVLRGEQPPLAVTAAVLIDDLIRAVERRRILMAYVAYPIGSLILLGCIAVVLAERLPASTAYAPIVSGWWIAPPAALAILLSIAPALRRVWRLPGSGWARHLDQASRWSRAALVVQWRLTEAQARQVLDLDPTAFSTALAMPGAEAHCRLIAAWHAATALRRMRLTAWTLSLLILLCGGAVVASSVRLWTAAGL